MSALTVINPLNSITLRSHDYISKSFFSSLKCQQIILYIAPRCRKLSVIDFLHRASDCNSCRGHEWPLGVSIQSCFEKSCVSKRHCPLRDIYLPLSLLFLFFFLPLPFFLFSLSLIPPSSILLSLKLGAKSLHLHSQESLQKTG